MSVESFKKQIADIIDKNIDVSNLRMYDDFAGELLLQAHALVQTKYMMLDLVKDRNNEK